MPATTSQPQVVSRSAGPEFVLTAKVMLARRRSAEAINLLRRGLSIDPANQEASLLLAKALITARSFRDAQRTLARLLDRREDLQAYRLLVRICLALKDSPAAFKVATRATSAFPRDERLARLYQQALDSLEPEELPTEIDALPLGALVGLAPLGDEDGDELLDDTDPATPVTRKVSAEELALLARIEAETSEEQILAGPDTEETPDEEAIDTDEEPVDAHTPLDVDPPAGVEDPPVLVGAGDGFERPTARYGPLLGKGAPDLEHAVKRFIAAVHPEKPQLFTGLLGDGPAIFQSSSSPAAEEIESDEDALEAETLREIEQLGSEVLPSPPPLRLIGNRRGHGKQERKKLDWSALDAPTPSVPGLPPPAAEPEEQPTRPFSAPGAVTASVVTADLIGVDDRHACQRHPRQLAGTDPKSEPVDEEFDEFSAVEDDASGETTPSPAADIFPSFAPAPLPKGANGFGGSAAAVLDPEPSRLDTPTQIGKRSVNRPLLGPLAARPASRRQERRFLRRYWPAWFAAALLLLASVTVGSLLLVRRGQAEQKLSEARQLAHTYQARHLRAALYRAKATANLGGRNAEVLALAAAIHAQLAVEFGESDLAATAKLIDQAKQLGAAFNSHAADDLARANAYLVVATRTLPQAGAYLRKALKRHPRNTTIARLYAETLVREGKPALAAQVLHQMPADDAGVLGALAELQWRQGKRHGARAYLQAAASAGLSPDQVALRLARLELRSGQLSPKELRRLRALSDGSSSLSRFEHAWAQLLVAILTVSGDVATSDEALARATRNAPLIDGEFRYQAARLQRRLGHLDQALELILAARRHAPNDERYLTEEATLHLLMDRPALAASQLRALRALSSTARATLAETEIRLGELALAGKTLAGLPPTSVVRRTLEARSLLAERKPHQALRHLSSMKPTDPQVSLVRGLAELAAGQLTAAAASLDVVLYQNPRSAEGLWARGRVELARASGDEARRHLERASVANPHRLRYQIDLARLLVMLGDFEAARPRFEAVLRYDAHNLAALAGRALTAVELNHRKMATDLYALRASGHRNMATMLSMRRWMRQGRWTQANAELRRIDPRWLKSEPTGQRWQAEILRRRGKPVPASAVYYRLLSFPRARPAALLGLSELALEGRDLYEAHKHARQAVEAVGRGIYPARLAIEARTQLAKCLERGEDFDGALRVLKEVVELAPKRFEAHLMLGRISAEIKERAAAASHLKRALELRRDHQGARRLLDRLCKETRPQPSACGARG